MAAARSHNCLDLCVDQCSAETFVTQGAATQFPKTRTLLLQESALSSDDFDLARPHQGKWCFSRTPMQTFIDALPLAPEESQRLTSPKALRLEPNLRHTSPSVGSNRKRCR